MDEDIVIRIPSGWKRVRLGNVCKLRNGYAFNSGAYKTQGIPLIRISDIKNGGVSLKSTVRVPENDIYKDYIIKTGDILLAMSGATTGKFGIYKDKEIVYQNQRVGRFDIIKPDMLMNEYLFYLLYFLRRKIEKDAYGGAQPNISSKKVEDIEINLPFIEIQKQVVNKLSELFSEIDHGTDNLMVLQKQLEIYRQAILKSAFEGRFTEKYRNSENKSAGLDALIEEINLNIENQNKLKAKKINLLEKLSINEIDELSIAEKSWCYVRLSDICEDITDGDHQPPPKSKNGIPFITISNIDSNMKINFNNTFYVGEDYYEKLKDNRKPKKGDILYTVTGSYGIPVLIDFNKEFCFQRHIALIRPYQSIAQKFIYYYLQSKYASKQADDAATGTAQKTVSLKGLRSFIVPLPPKEEQVEIVKEIEKRMSQCENIEKIINENLEKVEALKQSILKKAFEGKLVSEEIQDNLSEAITQS